VTKTACAPFSPVLEVAGKVEEGCTSNGGTASGPAPVDLGLEV
jgi:hypothetical protein